MVSAPWQTAIEVHCRLYAAVTEQAADALVIAGAMPQENGRGRMPELVRRDTRPDRLPDALGDLGAERVRRLDAAGLARKQPRIIRSAQQDRTKLVYIFVDEVAQNLVERKLERHPFLTS